MSGVYFRLRILMLRVRRTIHDYRVIWRPADRTRIAHLMNCWRVSQMLIIVDRQKRVIYEVK